MSAPLACTARLDRNGHLAVTWRDGTGRHRSEHVDAAPVLLYAHDLIGERVRPSRRRWAFHALARQGWAPIDDGWETDGQGADCRAVVRSRAPGRQPREH